MIVSRKEAIDIFFTIRDGNRSDKIVFNDKNNSEQIITIKLISRSNSKPYKYIIGGTIFKGEIKYQQRAWEKIEEILNKAGFKESVTFSIDNNLNVEEQEDSRTRIDISKADDRILQVYEKRVPIQNDSVREKMKEVLLDVSSKIKRKVIDELLKEKIIKEFINKKLIKGVLKEKIYDEIIRDKFFEGTIINDILYKRIIDGYLEHREKALIQQGKIKVFMKPGSCEQIEKNGRIYNLDYADIDEMNFKIFGISWDPGLSIDSNGNIGDIAYSRDCMNKKTNSIQSRIYRDFIHKATEPTMVIFEKQWTLIGVWKVIRAYRNNKQAREAGEPEAYSIEDLEKIKNDPRNIEKFHGYSTKNKYSNKEFKITVDNYWASINYPYLVIQLIKPNEHNWMDISNYVKKERLRKANSDEQQWGTSRYVDKKLFYETFGSI